MTNSTKLKMIGIWIQYKISLISLEVLTQPSYINNNKKAKGHNKNNKDLSCIKKNPHHHLNNFRILNL